MSSSVLKWKQFQNQVRPLSEQHYIFSEPCRLSVITLTSTCFFKNKNKHFWYWSNVFLFMQWISDFWHYWVHVNFTSDLPHQQQCPSMHRKMTLQDKFYLYVQYINPQPKSLWQLKVCTITVTHNVVKRTLFNIM